ncbi:MAG: hypothetical protein Q7T87_12760 [Polaromonas sp.]|nr:hypothetical protein [Polaromonas sp.]
MSTTAKSKVPNSVPRKGAKAPGTHKPAEKPNEKIGPEQSTSERIPSDVPHVYADMIADVQYGVYTTKLVFAIETGRQHQRDVGVLTIPTTALLVAAGNILNSLTIQESIDETTERYSAALELRGKIQLALKGGN